MKSVQRKATGSFREDSDLVLKLRHWYVDAHILECGRIEHAFDAILESAAQCDIRKRTIREQIWAVVERTIAEIDLVHRKLGEFVVKSPTADGFAFMNPLNVKIEDDQGKLFNPDGLIGSFIENMGSSIKLLAYQGALLHGRRIVVPPYMAQKRTCKRAVPRTITSRTPGI